MTEAQIAVELAKRPVAVDTRRPVELDEDDEGRAAALFLALDTQWNWASTGTVQGNGGYGVRTGLKYEVIAPTAAALGIAVDRALLMDLRVMEAEALKTFAEDRK